MLTFGARFDTIMGILMKRLGLLLAVLGTPAYMWWNPAPPPLNGKSFGPNEIRQLELDARDFAATEREAGLAGRFYALHSCRQPNLPVLTAQNARNRHISAKIVAATVVAESSCNASAVSPKGAVGLMQINLKVWRYSRQEMMNPARNLQIGTQILADYIHQTGNVRDGLRHYYGIVGNSTDADDYADKILKMAR